MSAAPRYKVYTADGEYVAACKYAEDAAAIIASYGNGSQIRDGHKRTVYTEGEHPASAGDSYDRVAEIVNADQRTTKAKREESTP